MPRETSALRNQIETLLLSTERPGIDNLIGWLKGTDYYSAPASRNNHSCFIGGLAFHSCSVLNVLSSRVEALGEEVKSDWTDESIIICALLHDLCKIGIYHRVGVVYVFEDRELPLGHGEKSVILAMEYIKLTDFEKLAIRWHSGLPELYSERMGFNQALKLHPSILYLHLADFESSVMFEKQ